jgi:2-succinyl-5-enolpyruvyl-6-hydroxy-3-cyclohexene-1-carboxylate synthase
MNIKAHISILPVLLKAKGIEQVVISPGSRNAPLIQVFHRNFGESCMSIVDERSAAYFALGLAVSSKKPVAILTTSGTAVLNLGPALAEAYYQGVPLLAITADRPAEWIDQEDNQTIRQNRIFRNIKKGFELPVQVNTEEDLWLAERIINEAANMSMTGKPGPVHINVPLREPLYELLPKVDNYRIIDETETSIFRFPEKLKAKFQHAKSILIVAGQLQKDEHVFKSMAMILEDKRICMTAEPISNLTALDGVVNADLILAAQPEKYGELIPDLILYLGGQVISKNVKLFLRKIKNCEQWVVSPGGNYTDTFKGLGTVIKADVGHFIEYLATLRIEGGEGLNFQEKCISLFDAAKNKIKNSIEKLGYSDLTTFYALSKKITSSDIVFIGNSSIVRLFQIFSTQAAVVYSNRGTSGIDGCLSTAAGIARNSEGDVYAILGDLSFLYDSNGLWNAQLPNNLKIIVINNNGGGVFSLLEGPSSLDAFEPFFKASHQVQISKLCEAYQVKYYFCTSIAELDHTFAVIKAYNNTVLLEIKTPEEDNTIIFRKFIEQLKS